MTGTVLVLGASGKIGSHAVRAFRSAGWQVRTHDRAKGDMTEDARGADVIVNGLNPPNYHNWARLIPEITGRVITAARASGAMVIVPGNVYNFGAAPGTWSEDTPHRATTRKGRIRIEMERAYRDSGVQTLILRAGNFIDPGREDDVMGLFLMRNIRRGRLIYPGNPDTVQTYCYLPDWAEAAMGLAGMRRQLATFEDVPFPGHAFTANALAGVLSQALGRQITVTGFPWWAMRLAAPFWEVASEMLEMRYLWNTPHRLSGAKLARLLPGFEPAEMVEVMLAGLPADIRPARPVAQKPRALGA